MKKKLLVIGVVLISTLSVYSGPPVEEGKLIFSTRCASCHNVNMVVLGPALAGVDQRRSLDWIIHFVHSSQTVIRSGDPAAVVLYEKFNKIPMPDHPDLSPDNIKNILSYIKSETKDAAVPTLFRPEKIRPAYIPVGFHNFGFFISYLSLIILLSAALLALVRIKEIQRKQGGR